MKEPAVIWALIFGVDGVVAYTQTLHPRASVPTFPGPSGGWWRCGWGVGRGGTPGGLLTFARRSREGGQP